MYSAASAGILVAPAVFLLFTSGVALTKKARDRLYYLRHKQEVLAKNAVYRRKNFEQHRKQQAEYRAVNRERILERKAEFRKNNPEKVKASARAHYLRNSEKIRASSSDYFYKNHSKCRERATAYQRKNRTELLLKAAEYRRTCPDSVKQRRVQQTKEWRQNNHARYLAQARDYCARITSTPEGRLARRMSGAIYRALRGKNGKSWKDLVGFSVGDLKRHIESRFARGMSWKHLLAGRIQIDHVIPKSTFHYSSPDDLQFKQCWALENLQPLWKTENLSKGVKLIRHETIPLGL